MREILIWVGGWCVASFVVMVLFHIGKLTTRLKECEDSLAALVPPDGYSGVFSREMTSKEKHGPHFLGVTK